MLAVLDLGPGNPSSVHGPGRAARAVLETARRQVAGLAGVDPARVIFTSGGTEANTLALALAGRRVLVSAVEHDSVLAAVPAAMRLPVDRHGVLALDALERELAAGDVPVLVSVMLANNETGVIQPLADVIRIARAYGARVHCDAVQAAGRLALEPLLRGGVDMMTLSAHKLGGPAGVGALMVADGVTLEPLLRGGGQERRRRAGTENLAGIAGFGAAAAAARRDLDTAGRGHVAGLRDRLEERALAAVPRAWVAGAGAGRLDNTTCLVLPGVAGETQVMALDLAGVAVSAGAACSSGRVRPSHVLEAMGVGVQAAASAIRISLGATSQPEDIDGFLAAWTAVAGTGRG
jgi:cysteine desulfurase